MSENSFLNKLSNLVFPKHIKCVFCNSELSAKTPTETCENCYKNLPFKNQANLCQKCGDRAEGVANICLTCKSTVRHFEKAISPFFYESQIRTAVQAMKFSNAKFLFAPMASYLAKEYYKQNLNVDFVVFVPMYVTALKKRGYNQSQMLAQEFAKITNLNVLGGLVEKVKNTSRQTELSLMHRHTNVKDTFKVFGKALAKDKQVLLIDDVLTSGGTASEISKVLIKAGAKKVFVLTLARTHLKESKQKSS